LKCRKVIPLSCEHLDMFSEHVLHKHKFNLSLQHSILYGYCEDCDN
jgi:Fur family ferric uptake transcriptional regulator